MYSNNSSDQELKTVYFQPQYQASGFMDGVVVPFLQSAITGLLSGLLIGAVTAVLKFQVNPWQVGFIAGVGAALLGWLSYRGRWMGVIESLLGLDLNRDGTIGQPVKPLRPETIRIDLISDEGRRGDFIDLPYPEKLPSLAAGIMQGRQFAQSVWTGQGGLFSRSEFETLRAELLRRNLARWKKEDSPSQGVELTPAGRAVFRRLAQDYSYSPTLPGES